MGCGGRPCAMQRMILPVLALMVLLAACGASQGGGPSDPGASGGAVIGDWVLTGGSIDGVDAPVLPDHRITMTITGGTIGGSAACNSYGGDIAMRADGLHLENLAQTEMACEEPAMAAEAAYLAALGRVREIVRDGEELVARGDGVELRFATLPPPPTADLVGTSWVLDTVLVGDVAASPIGERALLELNADGTFSGSTGCRSFSGGWTEEGDQIVAPSWGMDEETCPAELSAQDDHIVSVIGDGFIPTIEGDLLTLMDPGGIGLVYRAGE
jgi:heat shock protein HslJ